MMYNENEERQMRAFICDRAPEYQRYIADQAFNNDGYGNDKTYIVYDKEIKCMIAYISVKLKISRS